MKYQEKDFWSGFRFRTELVEYCLDNEIQVPNATLKYYKALKEDEFMRDLYRSSKDIPDLHYCLYGV